MYSLLIKKKKHAVHLGRQNTRITPNLMLLSVTLNFSEIKEQKLSRRGVNGGGGITPSPLKEIISLFILDLLQVSVTRT